MKKPTFDNISSAITNDRVVEVFTFHISRLELGSIEQQAMNHLLSVCMARDLDFKVVHSRIGSVDMSIKFFVFDVPGDVYEHFYIYNIRPVY